MQLDYKDSQYSGHAMKKNPSPLLGTYKAEPSLP